MRAIGKVRQRWRQLDLAPATWFCAIPDWGVYADRFIAPRFVRLAVGGDEQPPRLPFLSTLSFSQSCFFQVVAVAAQ